MDNVVYVQGNNLGKIATALAKAQSEMEAASKDKKNPFFKSNYADLASVFNACRAALNNNGIAISQPIETRGERMFVVTLLIHGESGEFIRSEMMLPNQLDPQKIGSAITYFRRYSLMSVAGVATDDDDGNEASRQAKMHTHVNRNKPQPPKVDPEAQKKAQQEFAALLKDQPKDTLQKALDWCQVKSIGEIPYDKLVKLLDNLKNKKAA